MAILNVTDLDHPSLADRNFWFILKVKISNNAFDNTQTLTNVQDITGEVLLFLKIFSQTILTINVNRDEFRDYVTKIKHDTVTP